MPIGRPKLPDFTDELKDQWLDLYQNDPKCKGMKGQTCMALRISPLQFQRAMRNDEAFGEAVKMTERAHWEAQIVPSMVERAVNGVAEPIIGGKFKDQHVGEKIVYSDSLLHKLAVAYLEEFRPRTPQQDLEQQPQGSVLVVPGTPMSPQQWQEQYASESKPKDFD